MVMIPGGSPTSSVPSMSKLMSFVKCVSPVCAAMGGQSVVQIFGVDYAYHDIVLQASLHKVTEMYGRSDIHFVDTRYEEGAAFMAYGYARASGKPTVCITRPQGQGRSTS